MLYLYRNYSNHSNPVSQSKQFRTQDINNKKLLDPKSKNRLLMLDKLADSFNSDNTDSAGTTININVFYHLWNSLFILGS